jgi:hypothetical protein
MGQIAILTSRRVLIRFFTATENRLHGGDTIGYAEEANAVALARELGLFQTRS